MTPSLSGRCACGAISYTADAEPLAMVNCHCRDCQRGSGSAFAAVVIVPQSSVKAHGEVRYYRTAGDSGMAVERGFYPHCGSPVMIKLERMPDAIGLQAASLDDPSQYRPTVDIFTTSAQPWDCMRPELQKRPRGFAS